jgi:hypothetical protein
MQKASSESNKNKENVTKDKKPTTVQIFNLLLSKIGKALNTSQLSNYK